MKKRVSRILVHIVFYVMAVMFILPLLYAIFASFKPATETFAWPPTFFPQDWTIENFKVLIRKYPILLWLRNSLFVSVVTMIITVILDVLAGYAFARLHFKGKKALFLLAISMMFIPQQIYIVPLYLMFNKASLLNTWPALILPATATVTGVYILKGFFESVPMEIEEAARIDGASDWKIFMTIMLPLSKSSIASVGILSFVSSWNSFLWPMIATRTDTYKTLPVGVTQFFGAGGAMMGDPQYELSLASITVVVIPTLIVFICLQKYFVRGVMNSGIKG